MDSPYRTKKYHYNYRHQTELSDDNLKKTFANMVSRDKVQLGAGEKSVRDEYLNWDAMNSEAREEQIYLIRQKLDELGEVPDDQLENFSQTSPEA